MKNCFGSTFDNFLGKGSVRIASKINITFFITNEVLNILLFNSFSKKAVFSEKTAKPGARVSSEGKGTSGGENECNLFYRKGSFEHFFHFTIFLKKATFLEKMGEKIFGGHDHCSGLVRHKEENTE